MLYYDLYYDGCLVCPDVPRDVILFDYPLPVDVLLDFDPHLRVAAICWHRNYPSVYPDVSLFTFRNLHFI